MADKKKRTDYNREYSRKRRSTEEGKKKNVEAVLKWREENKEARQAYNREWMRKRRAEAKAREKGEEV
jgi:hypothetical protein